MLVNAIIAEYNPFHNGHFYHLTESAKLTAADHTIVVMSGNFVQRGAPALLHKYARAEMALNCGADLVLELPPFYACASAEYFAQGAVSILDQLGVVDFLCFGSEQGDLSKLQQIADILSKEPADYHTLISQALSQGASFPIARGKALSALLPSDQHATDTALSLPNNILAIEYLKALSGRRSGIRPFTIARSGAGYHDTSLTDTEATSYPSASALRNRLLCNSSAEALQPHMPKKAFQILAAHLQHTRPMTPDCFSQLLLYKLLTEEQAGYTKYLDITPAISDKIRKTLPQFTDFDSFCTLLKSKDLTYTRISRCLLHILLDIQKGEMDRYRSANMTPYARVLGLNKNAAPLLAALKAHSSIPLITKLADADKLLTPSALTMLQKDIQISHIYNAAEIGQPTGNAPKNCMRNEYRMQLPILS